MAWFSSKADRFRKAKYTDLFVGLDRDRNGCVESGDLLHAAHALATACDLPPDSAAARQIHAALRDLWDAWSGVMDEDVDGVIRLDEFVGYHATLAGRLHGGGAMPHWATGAFHTLFSALDLDGDGRISRAEYAAWLGALGSSADAAIAFEALDLDGDGVIAVDELDALYAAWVTAGEPGAPGNLLMTGRLPG